jgi:hypothetical protein
MQFSPTSRYFIPHPSNILLSTLFSTLSLCSSPKNYTTITIRNKQTPWLLISNRTIPTESLRWMRRLLVTANVVPSSPMVVTLLMDALSSSLHEPHDVTSQKTAFVIYISHHRTRHWPWGSQTNEYHQFSSSRCLQQAKSPPNDQTS